LRYSAPVGAMGAVAAAVMPVSPSSLFAGSNFQAARFEGDHSATPGPHHALTLSLSPRSRVKPGEGEESFARSLGGRRAKVAPRLKRLAIGLLSPASPEGPDRFWP
jgi:hypothetical protein